MFSFHLFKRQANRRGIFLLTLFCVYAIVLLIGLLVDFPAQSNFLWRMANSLLLLFVLASLANPVISLLKPGFSYKGHPGMRHMALMVSGCGILAVCLSMVATNFLVEKKYLLVNDLLFFGGAFVMHGIHCLVLYGSFFKGPTSKFGKLYQPFLPIIE